jgi:hypothetical protein
MQLRAEKKLQKFRTTVLNRQNPGGLCLCCSNKILQRLDNLKLLVFSAC